jgi:hypothetical protein
MHRLARRAGYPSDSSRADRQQPGHGRRAEARRTTATPTTDSVTSATDPAAPRPGGATWVHGPVPARARNHRHRPRPPQRARARCPTVTVPGPPLRSWARCPAEDDSASSGGTASVTAPGRRSVPGRCRPGIARRVGPVASDCAARCGPIGFHSDLRTDRRTAGLLCHAMGRTPSARLHALGAAPGRQRDEEIAAVGRTLCVHRACREHERRPVPGQGRTAEQECGPVPGQGRTSARVKFVLRAAGRGSWAGRRTGPAQVSKARGQPALKPGPRAVSVRPQVGY